MTSKEYMNMVAELGCIVCQKFLGEQTPPEIHHLRSGMGMSMRNDDWHILPLCKIHHRLGDGKPHCRYQIGFHFSPARFEEMYGTENELRELVNEFLGLSFSEILDKNI